MIEIAVQIVNDAKETWDVEHNNVYINGALRSVLSRSFVSSSDDSYSSR